MHMLLDDLDVSPVRAKEAQSSKNEAFSKDAKENCSYEINIGSTASASDASEENLIAEIKSLAAELDAVEEKELLQSPQQYKDTAHLRTPSRDIKTEGDGDDNDDESKEDEVVEEKQFEPCSPRLQPIFEDKVVDCHKSERRASMTPAAGGWRLKYDSALQQIGQLQTSNSELQNEVSKLKLSLALKEAEFVTMQETPRRSESARKPPLPPKSSTKRASARKAPTSARDAMTSRVHAQRRAQRALSSPAAVKARSTRRRREEGHLKQSSRPADAEDAARGYSELFHDLIESESFQLVGSGESVLDQLSEDCRRDVVLRYCDILDSISNSFLHDT
ncbi:Hypothetical Protein FCC1311_030432 [Hondaea fermentalgiana]|uniref:Uncharacterized protein n=1 Tax=Hondaea fermentalgiana TaxID=2315210 RepID=A0A2R5GEY3_9STRA|nr:Hypothetical Protein FCC1311_030432 [Hondaea fermentalgiana]|eukprot:GBG26821.1 Hypothetical Protein FCC1311_030432 [Hondaea fermentalgiana]